MLSPFREDSSILFGSVAFFAASLEALLDSLVPARMTWLPARSGTGGEWKARATWIPVLLSGGRA